MNRLMIIVLLLSLLESMEATANARIWSDREGRQVEAEYRGVSDGKVRIVRVRDRKTFEVPIERLSEADQELVRLLMQANTRAKAISENTAESTIALSSLPTQLTVSAVDALLRRAKIASQGCGYARWRGDRWGAYGNFYEPLVTPWSDKPVRVTADFAYGREPVEHHLIGFTVAGVAFRRLETSDVLVRHDLVPHDLKK